MTVLADTSVWVECLRRGKGSTSDRLDGLLVAGEVLVCGPVVAELLAGAKAAELPRFFDPLTAAPQMSRDGEPMPISDLVEFRTPVACPSSICTSGSRSVQKVPGAPTSSEVVDQDPGVHQGVHERSRHRREPARCAAASSLPIAYRPIS